jgi:hypothetical protein
MKPQTVYSKVRKYLEGCSFLLANFENVPVVPFADLEEHLPSYRYLAPVTAACAPRLAGVFDVVCERLKVPRGYVHGFIVPSPVVGACCRHDIKGHAVIEVNAGMVARLSTAELTQAIAHEVGHFVLPIQPERLPDGRPISWEDARISRHAELAMDRIGLVASRDLEAACRMLLKTHVGLPEEDYRYDVAAFLEAVSSGLNAPVGEIDACGQHPHIPFRIRALRLFAQSDYYLGLIGKDGGLPITEVNAILAADLHAAVDGYAELAMAEALTGVGSCLYALAVVSGASAQHSAFSEAGLPVDMALAKSMAKHWASLPDDEWVNAYKSELSVHLQAAAVRCPRTLNQGFESLVARFPGTDMEAKLTEVREVFAHCVSAVD